MARNGSVRLFDVFSLLWRPHQWSGLQLTDTAQCPHTPGMRARHSNAGLGMNAPAWLLDTRLVRNDPKGLEPHATEIDPRTQTIQPTYGPSTIAHPSGATRHVRATTLRAIWNRTGDVKTARNGSVRLFDMLSLLWWPNEWSGLQLTDTAQCSHTPGMRAHRSIAGLSMNALTWLLDTRLVRNDPEGLEPMQLGSTSNSDDTTDLRPINHCTPIRGNAPRSRHYAAGNLEPHR